MHGFGLWQGLSVYTAYGAFLGANRPKFCSFQGFIECEREDLYTGAMTWPPDKLSLGDYEAEFYPEIFHISAATWNAHNEDDFPFLRHEFLAHLERSQSVGQKAGMLPMHLELKHLGHVVGYVPLYLKFHSYGEYIFDWEWARGAQSAGIDYYPKLLVGAPYTPAVGNRLLMAPQHYQTAGEILRAFCVQHEISGVHVLHCLESEAKALGDTGFIQRETHQYHFHNPGHENFAAFLSSLKSRHRKQIQKERMRARDNKLTLSLERGDALTANDWMQLYALYENTYQRKWGSPYLTASFFKHLPKTIQQKTLVATARDANNTIQAMSLSWESDSRLYGRYWGCAGAYDAIHFEFCYYRLIEHAITSGKVAFEAGAQGEHKIKRGFMPVPIYSAHVFVNEALQKAVAHFCRRETRHESKIRDFLGGLAPFKSAT